MNAPLLNVDRVCERLKEEMRTSLSSAVYTEDEILTRLTDQYRGHLYVQGFFEFPQSFANFRSLVFVGTICGETRTITVHQ